jgi:hypothetical protein
LTYHFIRAFAAFKNYERQAAEVKSTKFRTWNHFSLYNLIIRYFDFPFFLLLVHEFLKVSSMDKQQTHPPKELLLPDEIIMDKIYLIRSQKVMLDHDLAALYGVDTRRLNEQVKRNPDRFPEDFMFQLTSEEFENLKSQFATSGWGGRRKLPKAFTEHGVLML